MKFSDTTQAARPNAEFDKLREPEKAAVLRVVAMARKISGMPREYLLDNDSEAFAYRRSKDRKIAWGIRYNVSNVTRGVFPE